VITRFTASLLIALLAAQSVLAAVDVHLDVSPAGDHQTQGHSHGDTLPAEPGLLHGFVDEFTDHESQHDSEQSVECEHCCHCHSGTQVLAQINVLSGAVTLNTLDHYRAVRPASVRYPPILRPPIV